MMEPKHLGVNTWQTRKVGVPNSNFRKVWKEKLWTQSFAWEGKKLYDNCSPHPSPTTDSINSRFLHHNLGTTKDLYILKRPHTDLENICSWVPAHVPFFLSCLHQYNCTRLLGLIPNFHIQSSTHALSHCMPTSVVTNKPPSPRPKKKKS